MRTIITLIILGSIWTSCKNMNGKLEKKDLQATEMNVVDKSIQEEKDYSSLGYEIMQQDAIGSIKLGLDLNQVIKYLGEPDSISELSFSEVNGEYCQEVFYKDNGIELDFELEEDSTKTVTRIFVTKPCLLESAKSIGIGTHYDSVLVAYKDYINPNDTDFEQITAGTIYGGVIFLFEDKKVSSILIGAGAE